MKYIDISNRRELLKKRKEALFYRISQRMAFRFAFNILNGA